MNRPKRALLFALLTIATAIGFWHLRAAGDPTMPPAPPATTNVLKVSQNLPGDSKAITLHADEITTWTENSRRIILMRGAVWIEHGVLNARMQEAVAVVDQDRTKKTGVMHLDVYAEGDVILEQATTTQRGPKAILDLNTRGELKFKSQPGRLLQQPRPGDPLYRRALAEHAVPAPMAAPTVPSQPATSPIRQTSFQPAASDPLRPGGGGLGWGGDKGAPAVIQPVQAIVPPSPPVPSVPPIGIAPAQPGLPAPAAPPPGTLAPLPNAPPGSMPPSPMPDPGDAAGNPPAPPGAARAPRPPARPAPQRQIRIVPRTSAPFQVQEVPLSTGEKGYVVTGGVIITVANPSDSVDLLDMESDRLVIWTRGDVQQIFHGMRTPEGHTTREIEFYMAGNVEIREKMGGDSRTLHADEVYYDVSRNVAVAYQADLEYIQANIPDPIHVTADELQQLSPREFRALRSEVFSSKLPSDPGLKIYVAESTLERKRVPKKTFFGFGPQLVDKNTGEPRFEEEMLFRGRTAVLELEDVPVFYLPYIQGDPRDPLGPLDRFGFNYSRMFGFQVDFGLNVFDLFGLDPVPGTRWMFDVGYMTKRGPNAGTDFHYAGTDMFDVPGLYTGLIKAWGINDTGKDLLGANRGNFGHPDNRGRFLFRHNHQLPEDFTLWMQVSALSDKNFLEQYYYNEFNTDINQETFIFLKQQRENWAWTLHAEERIRNWVNETERLPQVDGYLIGQSFFDLLTYNVHGSAGYDRFMASHVPPPNLGFTNWSSTSGRFDLWQDLSLPFTLGPVRLVPYGIVDLTYYTNDLYGDDRGRFYGAGGIRGSMPLTRLYPGVQSDLMNLNGINHKILLSTNYYVSHSDTPFTAFAQFDRLQDDASDQSVRDMAQIWPGINPVTGPLLATSAVYDPQVYAIRRLVDNRIDTLDTVEVLQANIRQRLQTKRGYPGMQHIVDWMTLDLSGSFFPHPSRDDFGELFALLTYDYSWHLGDRTTLVSQGWYDPIDHGARYWNVGAYVNRPDRTQFYVGYRQTDPLESQLLMGNVTYILSPKYAITAVSSYNFATNQGLSNGFVFTRMGSDLQISFGFNYNAILNNVGFTLGIVPNLAGPSGSPRGSMFNPNAGGNSSLAGR